MMFIVLTGTRGGATNQELANRSRDTGATNQTRGRGRKREQIQTRLLRTTSTWRMKVRKGAIRGLSSFFSFLPSIHHLSSSSTLFFRARTPFSLDDPPPGGWVTTALTFAVPLLTNRVTQPLRHRRRRRHRGNPVAEPNQQKNWVTQDYWRAKKGDNPVN